MVSSKRVSLLTAVLLLLTCSVVSGQFPYAANSLEPSAESKVEWWRDARFGMFIHWGVYSIPARGEWVMWDEQIPVEEYAKLANQFNPQHYDPKQWAELAHSSGMKYMVMTARHHDGFALFNDPGNDFTSVKTGAKRDLVAEFVSAVRGEGLRVGLYYSPLDWRFPGYFFPDVYLHSAEELRDEYHRQLNELASNYGKIDILWFDGGGNDWLGLGGIVYHGGWKGRSQDEHYKGRFDWQDEKAVAALRALQPNILTNDRVIAPADFRVRESDESLGDFENRYPWELNVTIVKGAYGYQAGAQVKSLEYLVRLLVQTVGRDGNFLLNVGPMSDGQIAPEQAQRLREIGEWLKGNGESIFGTRGGPWLPGAYGVSTHRDKIVYLHLLKTPLKTGLWLPALPARVLKVSLLNGSDLTFRQTGPELRIDVPENSVNPIDTVLKVELEKPWNTLAVVPVPDPPTE